MTIGLTDQPVILYLFFGLELKVIDLHKRAPCSKSSMLKFIEIPTHYFLFLILKSLGLAISNSLKPDFNLCLVYHQSRDRYDHWGSE